MSSNPHVSSPRAVCDNGDDLFSLSEGQPFACRYSSRRFDELQRILLSPWEEPYDSKRCHTSHSCVERDLPPRDRDRHRRRSESRESDGEAGDEVKM